MATFVTQYDQRLRHAKDTYKELDHRHRSIYAAIDISVRALPAHLRDLLSGLWVFNAPFLPETAVAVFDPNGQYPEGEQSPVFDHLYQLWRRGLLAVEVTTHRHGNLRLYRVVSTVRLYAEEMPEAYERERLLTRFGTATMSLAEALHNGIDSSGRLVYVATRTITDLVRGIELFEHRNEAQGYFLLHVGHILSRLGNPVEGTHFLERALKSAEGRYPELEARNPERLGVDRSRHGKPAHST